MNFNTFKLAVAQQFARISAAPLFYTQVSKDDLWHTYLSSFPEGTNPLYRERTEHDCNCCKQFIRAVGNVVAVTSEGLVSIWDITLPESESAYQAVANALSNLVKSQPIENIFLTTEKMAGTDKNFEDTVNGVKTWEHFFVNVPRQFQVAKTAIGPKLGEARACHDVLLRSLKELTPDAIQTTLELIAQNSLYRGEEFKNSILAFQTTVRQSAAAENLDHFAWRNYDSPVAKLRNTAMGTLLVDLSEGRPLEDSVKSYEQKVAPQNYKRPTALVTQRMIDEAKKTINELGLTSALERRYARIEDLSVNNLLYVDRSFTPISNSPFDELAPTQAFNSRSIDKIEEVPIDKFISNILPSLSSLEVLLENHHASNLTSLIAPVDPTAPNLFKWDNPFSWSYNGDMADSIKERVKKAGGSVTGDLCCRLAWFNYDDLDFHMIEPGGHRIYFATRSQTSPSGGRLDVDMNAGHGVTREPVENIFYASRSRMREGTYELVVNNYYKREADNVGFEVEMDYLGTVYSFSYPKGLRTAEFVTVAKFKYTHANGIEFIESLPTSQATRTVWNLSTQTFHKVKALMLSPNYWQAPFTGNKHFFFMLEGCQSDAPARGFFNEFLRSDLNDHRKVIELVGSKMKTQEDSEQLSGLGFSSTQRNHLLCRVKGSFTRLIKVVF